MHNYKYNMKVLQLSLPTVTLRVTIASDILSIKSM